MKLRLKAAFAAAVFAVSGTFAQAADWAPSGPIKMIIAFAAGGGADTQARLIAEDIQAATGWEVIPEQITGKGGVNALLALQDMPSDGTAIALVVTESLGYNAAAAKGAGVAPEGFTGLTTTAGFQMAVVSKANKGWTSFEDMIAEAKDGGLRFGTMSPKLSDLAFLLGDAQGVEFNIVQVRGGRAVMDGVQAGDMDLGFMAGIQGKGVASGDLVNLASALSGPLQQTPEAPTFDDLGVAFNADGYFAFVGPAGMDPAAREAITAAIVAASTSGKAAGMISNAFGGAVNIQGAELDALLKADFEAAGALIEAAQ
ncbi:MAG: tripartite tricarboxylate transporter substrate-binding protein [Pseudomonadota bacterium]